ncbi:hypothetical protein [Granulicatella sp.]
MEEIYNGLYQVQEALTKIDKETMVAAVCNQSGKVQFIVQLMHNKEGQFAAFFHKTVREFQHRIKAEDTIVAIAETEEDLAEIEGLRKGIQIVFVPLEFIPKSQKETLRNLGITRKKKKLYPLIFSLNDSKLLSRDLKVSEVNFCKRVVDWLTQEGNLALLAATTKPTENNTLPKITYNTKKKESVYDQGDILQFEEELPYEEFIGYKGEKPHLYVPELTLYRVKKGIKASIPDAFEIRLMFSPTHFYGNDEKNGPQYILIIAFDLEIAIIEPLDKLDPAFIQNTLLEFYNDVPITPGKWTTKGVFAPFLKDCLDSVMEFFKTPFEISSEDSVIDTYTFDHFYHLITSDDPYYDFDDYDDYEDFDLSEELREFRDFHKEAKKAPFVEKELEEFQNAMIATVMFLAKNSKATTNELKKHLKENEVRKEMIAAVFQELDDLGYTFPNLT